jgi:hypothetical protein
MARLLKVKVSPDGFDRVASWVAGVGLLAACTAISLAALPTVPSPTGFVLGVGIGVAWAVVAWATPKMYVRSRG